MKKFLIPAIAAAVLLVGCESTKTVSFKDVEIDYPEKWELFYENPQDDNYFFSIAKDLSDSTYFGEISIAVYKDDELNALTDPEDITDYLIGDAYIFAEAALPDAEAEDIVYKVGLAEDSEFSYDTSKEPYMAWYDFEAVYNGKPYHAEVCAVKLGDYEIIAFAQGESEDEVEEYLTKTFDTARLK